MDSLSVHQMKHIQKKRWTWFIRDTSILEPWFFHYKKYEESPIKKNSQRTVFKVSDKSKNKYYIKHDHPCGFFPVIKSYFRSKSSAEYRSWLCLVQNGIPCVEYVGLGFCKRQSMLITKSLEKFIPCTEFWYSVGKLNGESTQLFFQALCRLIKMLVEAKIYHPDFHQGNLMINPKNMQIVLVDVYGVKCRQGHYSTLDMISVLRIFWDFSEAISDEDIIRLFRDCNQIFSIEKSLFVWHSIKKNNIKLVEKEWSRRKKQILSGNSKFCRTIQSTEKETVIIRNTMWFSPCERNLKQLKQENYDSQQAKKIWLDSFKNQLLHIDGNRIPLAWQKGINNVDILFF